MAAIERWGRSMIRFGMRSPSFRICILRPRSRVLTASQLGEDRWRIHTVGAPGIDGIAKLASKTGLPRRSFALLVLHPTDADEQIEYRRAHLLLESFARRGFARIVIVHPNNDPGSRGIARCWEKHANDPERKFIAMSSVADFSDLCGDAAVMVGNSSSGIIEAASFGTPVIDIGPRQLGRERSENVTNMPWRQSAWWPRSTSWQKRKFPRFTGRNVYGGGGAGENIATSYHPCRWTRDFDES